VSYSYNRCCKWPHSVHRLDRTCSYTSLAGVVTPLSCSPTSPLPYTHLWRTSSLTQRSHRTYSILHFGCLSGPRCGLFQMESAACQRLRCIRPVWLSDFRLRKLKLDPYASSATIRHLVLQNGEVQIRKMCRKREWIIWGLREPLAPLIYRPSVGHGFW
jgi:hypothetical protein